MSDAPKVIDNNLEEVPFQHYCELYSAMDPKEAAERCGVLFENGVFHVNMLDTEYLLSWPEYAISAVGGTGVAMKALPMQTFLLRFLLESRKAEPFLGYKTFPELPWGNIYIKPFTGRCITRAAYAFGTRIAAFRSGAERLGGVADTHGDASYFFELLPGYKMELIVWEGDDEFPPNSQILYSENFGSAFSAEDRVKAGDILITAVKAAMSR